MIEKIKRSIHISKKNLINCPYCHLDDWTGETKAIINTPKINVHVIPEDKILWVRIGLINQLSVEFVEIPISHCPECGRELQ